MFLSCWVWRFAAHFAAVGATFYTTARLNAARFSAVSVSVILPISLLLIPLFTLRLGEMPPVIRPLVLALCCSFSYCWCRFLHYGEGKRCPFFSCWCRRYAAHSTAVGAAFSKTARVNAARIFSAVGVGVTLPFTAVDAAF